MKPDEFISVIHLNRQSDEKWTREGNFVITSFDIARNRYRLYNKEILIEYNNKSTDIQTSAHVCVVL